MFLPSSHTGKLALGAALQRAGLRATPFQQEHLDFWYPRLAHAAPRSQFGFAALGGL